MLAAGAFVGLATALLAVAFVDQEGGSDVQHLARFAFVLPPAVFVLWWLLFPGIAVDRGELSAEEAAAAVDGEHVDTRITRIVSAFDGSPVPRPTRTPQPDDPAARNTLMNSVRRDPNVVPLDETNAYGLRRRVPPPAPVVADVVADVLADEA